LTNTEQANLLRRAIQEKAISNLMRCSIEMIVLLLDDPTPERIKECQKIASQSIVETEVSMRLVGALDKAMEKLL